MIMSPAVPEEKTLSELKEQIEVDKQLGRSSKADEIKYHVKFSVPAACIVFALVSPVFAILFARTGGFVGVLISIVMVLLYYNGFVIGTQILSKYEFMHPWMCAWVTNIVFGVLGLIAIRRLE